MKQKVKYITIIVALFIFISLVIPNQKVFAATPTSDYIYNVYNKASGKCLNINYGTDANGTNVTQYTKDGSIEQRFKLVYNSSRNSYKLHAICSSNGNNRVLDILRTGGSASGAISAGCNVDIWSPNDNDAQDFIISDRGNGYYSLHPRVNTSLALTTNGTGNGSGAGTSSTATGNVYVSGYTGSDYQLWSFRENVIRNYYYTDFAYLDSYIASCNLYIPSVGYKYITASDQNGINILNDLPNSEVFLYFGHGDSNGGMLIGKEGGSSEQWFYANNTRTSVPSFRDFSVGSLNNTKCILLYACYSGKSSNIYGNLVDEAIGKGAQCAVGWRGQLHDYPVSEWNRLFWEKIYQENESIVEGFRHADYWLPSIVGDAYAQELGENARYSRGPEEIHLYK